MANKKVTKKLTKKGTSRVSTRPSVRPIGRMVAQNAQWLEVSLDPDPLVTPNVTVTPDPANAQGKKVRWVEDSDNVANFAFAGLDLDQTEWPNQKILIVKNRIISNNKGNTLDFEYVIYVRYNGKLYDSIDRNSPPTGGKPVIRNQ